MDSIRDQQKQPMNDRKHSTLLPRGGIGGNNKKQSESVFYEAKCAFSRYWIDFSIQGNADFAAVANDFDQFWRVYYPHSACKPLLKLVNCRLFYLKFHLLKRALFYLRKVKTRIVPIHEYDTGHGFKLFSS